MTLADLTGVTPAVAGAMPEGEYGPIISRAEGNLSEVHRLVGGTGTALWVHLLNGMHIAGPWGCVEFVTLPPGSSCGLHRHDEREAFYYVVSGTAAMTINGREVPVAAGDLVTCPIGTVHGIAVPAGAGEQASFLVVEAYPGGRAAQGRQRRWARIPMRDLEPTEGFWDSGHGGDVSVAQVNLGQPEYDLTGGLSRVTVIEIPEGETLGPYRYPAGISPVLFTVSGDAEITAGDAAAKGGAGLCVAAGLGGEVTVRNLSESRALVLLSTEMKA